ncbi:DEAD/DEAH box helicase [Metabacillus sp. KIGAM252]|uniref:DEAD/DEAH box helicase n=1 Tax=Metabacillus flavus TaxID=2823519 RepID=A0ABS5LIW2_9BACI|nr:DEAD/DEAH box helicase [Metabacillus flavus]MBS2970680.1 DEAD/DEAH box helicase [Metabacillus flavus]
MSSLQHHLSGRHLLASEIPFPSEMLENEDIQKEKGVTGTKGKFQCTRCLNKQRHLFASFHCAKCGRHCTYCRSCIMMGRVSECETLYSWIGATPVTQSSSGLDWTGTLSQLQSHASNCIKHAMENQSELLVWAVCGAGKTEILFQGIEEALKQNKRICLATPRTDVVLELYPRFQQAFPKADAAALYGGSEDRYKSSRLVLSTAHQLFRFKQTFDCIIIDEVDAFPFSADQTLQEAVQKARKPESSLIFLTATPSKEMQKRALSNKLPSVRIPGRYHGHPLPVPRFQWIGSYKGRLQRNKLPKPLLKWIQEHLDKEKPAFLFVPNIPALHHVTAILQNIHPLIEGVHSEDPDRKEKVQRFRDRISPLIVTTTILERGVTVPDSDAAVFGAEEDIFTESALVQIAGRVGRHQDYPTGDVVFFHYGKTNAMIQSRLHIKKMNREAFK